MAQRIEALIQEAIASTPVFPRISILLRRRFLVDISLVAVGIRTAYLLDLFSLSETVALHFAHALHAQGFLPLRNLRLLFHRDLCQTFFVNIRLFRDRFIEAHSSTPWTSFIRLTPEPTQHSVPPPEIFSVCESVLAATSPLDTSISLLTAPHMIALAGFLLEYPFSYMPVHPAQSDFLSEVPLCVVECFLISDHDSEHSLMKFSYPLNIQEGETYGGSADLTNTIRRRFESRFGLGMHWAAVRITCETRILDRVAL